MAAPVEDWEVESTVVADCYKRLLHKFEFFPTGKKHITFNLKLSESFAINNIFSPTSDDYNAFVRPLIEPKLPICKQLPSLA